MFTNSGESVLNLDNANTIITLNHASQLPTKLTGDNFPTWWAQLFTVLYGLDLLKFLDGSQLELAATAPVAERCHSSCRQALPLVQARPTPSSFHSCLYLS
ncbi:unnamed protein product [Linum trigynum]|uniref:Retrotransposon Copia-like N-terminal domain-containing protein n=1 Tax=Linum trigynum TaxID=586398 RepID=A0AAV2G6H1_9ROSI